MSCPITGVAHMVRRALNTLDYRLMDHGERVAYIVLALMKREGGYDSAQYQEACYLAMFHDIGAFQTEVIDSLVDSNKLFAFEAESALNHSIYSYLLLRDFSFLQELSDSVLFHHFPYPQLQASPCRNKWLAAKIFLADRLDILIGNETAETPAQALEHLDNPVFCPEDVARLRLLEKEEGLLGKLFNLSYLNELLRFLNQMTLTDRQTNSLVEMLPYAIDFRSSSTITHTVATVEGTMVLAELLGLPEEEKVKLYYGALLHDIGKISISLMLLEKPSALSDQEYMVIQDHVLLSEYILKGRVSREILQIAVRHHEKLDGSGYPYGITGAWLSQNERIVAVADILSALVERRSYRGPFSPNEIVAILQQHADDGKLCPHIVQLLVDNFDLVWQRVENCNTQTVRRYQSLTQEVERLYQQYAPVFQTT